MCTSADQAVGRADEGAMPEPSDHHFARRGRYAWLTRLYRRPAVWFGLLFVGAALRGFGKGRHAPLDLMLFVLLPGLGLLGYGIVSESARAGAPDIGKRVAIGVAVCAVLMASVVNPHMFGEAIATMTIVAFGTAVAAIATPIGVAVFLGVPIAILILLTAGLRWLWLRLRRLPRSFGDG